MGRSVGHGRPEAPAGAVAGSMASSNRRELADLAVALPLAKLRVTGELAVGAHAGLAPAAWLAARPCRACPGGVGAWGRDHADGVWHADCGG